MGWNDSSYDDLLDEYSASKGQYEKAASEWSSLGTKCSECKNERKQLNSQMDSLKSATLNFEKRLEGIEKIIGCMDGSMGRFAGFGALGISDIPSAISKAAKSISNAAEQYRGFIRYSGMAPADIAAAFPVKAVEVEAHSATALDLYRSEKSRLVQAIADNKAQIAAMSDQISQLTRQINAYSDDMAACKHSMNSAAGDMAAIKRAMSAYD